MSEEKWPWWLPRYSVEVQAYHEWEEMRHWTKVQPALCFFGLKGARRHALKLLGRQQHARAYRVVDLSTGNPVWGVASGALGPEDRKSWLSLGGLVPYERPLPEWEF